MRTAATPSIVFRTTLPVKPSVTTTSIAPPGMSRPSTLPTNPGVPEQQGVGRLDDLAALALLLADREEPDPRRGRCPGRPGRRGVPSWRAGGSARRGPRRWRRRRAAPPGPAGAGQDDRDGRPDDPRHAAHRQRRGRQHRAGVPGRHGRAGAALPHQAAGRGHDDDPGLARTARAPSSPDAMRSGAWTSSMPGWLRAPWRESSARRIGSSPTSRISYPSAATSRAPLTGAAGALSPPIPSSATGDRGHRALRRRSYASISTTARPR